MSAQLLLTDQRSPEKKQADAMLAIYRDAYPKLKDFWADNLGPVTGRWKGDLLSQSPKMQRIPIIEPAGEVILPKGDRRFREIDFGRIERRALAAYAVPKHVVDPSGFTAALDGIRDGADRFAKAVERMSGKVAEMTDRMILMALFGEIDLRLPEPDFARERRIRKLLVSSDRRQKKRGERLFKEYRREKQRARQAAKMSMYYRGYNGK